MAEILFWDCVWFHVFMQDVPVDHEWVFIGLDVVLFLDGLFGWWFFGDLIGKKLV